jgi:hypothetical protein
METNITKLRNKLTPSFNLPSMILAILKDEPKDTLTNMALREAKLCIENQKEIVRLINEIENQIDVGGGFQNSGYNKTDGLSGFRG